MNRRQSVLLKITSVKKLTKRYGYVQRYACTPPEQQGLSGLWQNLENFQLDFCLRFAVRLKIQNKNLLSFIIPLSVYLGKQKYD